MIHPTAIIAPSARLHPTVKVGPFAVIDGDAQIGEGCVISAHAIITGEVVMGKNNTIGHGALIGGEPQDLAFDASVKSRVVIGDGNRIREYATIHRGTAEGSETVVGDGCFLMVGVHLAHNVRLGDHAILANNVLLGGHVHMGSRVFIGGGATFHQHISVGDFAICQGGSRVSKNVPPYVITSGLNTVAGLNVIGLRRGGFDTAQRVELQRAFRLLYRSGLNVSQALDAAAASEWTAPAKAFWSFIASTKKKGICDWIGSRRRAEGVEE